MYLDIHTLGDFIFPKYLLFVYKPTSIKIKKKPKSPFI